MFSPGKQTPEKVQVLGHIYSKRYLDVLSAGGWNSGRGTELRTLGRRAAPELMSHSLCPEGSESGGARGVDCSGRGPLLRVRWKHVRQLGRCRPSDPCPGSGGRRLYRGPCSLVNVSSFSLSRAVGLMRVRTAGRRDLCLLVGWSACLWGCLSPQRCPASAWTGFRAQSV